MKTTLQKIGVNFTQIIDSPIYNDANEIISWHSIIFNNETALGGGFSIDRENALRIACAETIERKVVEIIHNNDELKRDFLMDLYSGTCGFAVGFENHSTALRAIFESCERWIWSKWIDDHYLLPSFTLNSENTSPSLCFFDEIKLFKKDISVLHPVFGNLNISIGIFLGLKNDGIFPGSRVNFQGSDIWDHAIIEAWRHYDVYQKLKHLPLDHAEDVLKRVIFFGNNAELALKSINKAHEINWQRCSVYSLRFSAASAGCGRQVMIALLLISHNGMNF
jgi:hypothetical protein